MHDKQDDIPMSDKNIPLVDENEPSPELLETVWKRRGDHLAQTLEQKDEGEQIQLLIFRLGREYYGIEAQYVFDIRLIKEITLVPRVPDWVVGVVTIRGQILSVIDLRRYFKLPAATSETKNQGDNYVTAPYQVSVETPAMDSVLLVDEVLSVESLAVNQIKIHTEVLGEMRPEYVRGIINYTHPKTDFASILIVLNLVALLADKSLIIEEKVL
jgi:purine-binding chemotaxis protein CheW